MDKEIVIYRQAKYSPFAALARDLLRRYQIPFREISIDTDATLIERLQAWTSQIHLPTLIIVTNNNDFPYEAPLAIPQPAPGTDQGSLIGAPNNQQLENWLYKHGFLAKPYKR